MRSMFPYHLPVWAIVETTTGRVNGDYSAKIRPMTTTTAPNFADRTIWTGDNLDILRGLNSASVDLIYLDPPFNSNRNYAAPVGSAAAGAAFKDTWTLSDLDVAWMGLIADEQPAMYQVLQTAGLTHGKGMQSYLCMMAVRLLEMRRVLKETGSIYLHCDPTASHYLKLLMDSIYGGGNFQNEITWQRTESHNTARRYGNITDTILFYTKSSEWVWNRIFHEHGGQAYSEEQLKRFRHVDADGRRYKLENLTAPRPDSDSGKFEWRGSIPGPTRGWGYRIEQLERWWSEGRIHLKRDGTPRTDGLKVYLDESEGKPLQNVWIDVPRIANTSSERIGYPTQKPLALLERIIKASSNEDDVVLDPFCGCATACVAAENLGRRWIGIDISPKAVELVNMRLQQTMGELFHNRLVTARADVPRRTDIDAPIPYRQNKHVLFGQQEGRCNGCKSAFEFRHLEVDHVIPQSAGGTDHIENLQLLCAHCNRVKGDRPQEYLVARLREMGMAA